MPFGCHEWLWVISTTARDSAEPWTGSALAEFHYHVLDRGIGHVYIKPATPRLNGKVERSHRIDEEEFYRMLAGVVIDDTGLFNDRLQEWERFYNFNRPHGALGGQTPYERLRQKTTSPV
jgi:transposase InsO family protein